MRKRKFLVVEYKVNDKTYTTERKVVYGIADDSHVGDIRQVSYNEYRPQYGYVRPTTAVYILYYTIVIIGLIILVIFIFVISKLLLYFKIINKNNYM